jgi:tetratricopeptide (TPR) repeat protein
MKRKGLLVAVIIPFMFVFGCVGGQKNFNTGQELSKKGRWGDAIGFYEEALKENPQNKEYAQSLAKAKKELALVHYRKAEKLLADNPDPTFPELDRIVKEAERAHGLDPQNSTITTLFSDLVKRKDALLATIASLYTQANSHVANKEWMDAIEKLRRVKKLFPRYEETQDKLATAEKNAAQIFYKQGIELSKKEDWGMAVSAFKAVIEIDPNYYDIQQLFKTAQANDNVNYFIKKGEEAIGSRNWDRAIFLHEKALEYKPDNEQLIKRIDALKCKGGQAHFDSAMKLSSQRKLKRAAEELRISLQYSPSLVESRLYKDFIYSLCQKLDQRSDVYIELKKWGNALVWLKQLDSINPDYKGLFRKLQLVEDMIKNRIRKSIAVFDFSYPIDNKDAGRIIASKLVTFLSKNASGDLKIIERENLQSILKEMQLGQTGLVDIDTAKRVGKMRGIDTFILGDVLHFSSKSKNYPSTNTVRVQIDTRTESNPDFERWRIVHTNPTEEEMKTAPPMKIEKPVYQLFTYETGTTKIMSFVEIAYKLVETMTGENIFADTVSGKLGKQDDYHHGIPAANIKEDPLELPAELEVLDTLTNQKVSEVSLSILKHFQSLELVYFNEGEKQLKRRRYEDAIEGYTDAIYDERLKGVASPISKKSAEMIATLTQDM